MSILLLFASSTSAADLASWMAANGLAPVDYVVVKARTHPIVIIGESHGIAHDAELISALVPSIAENGTALAMEILPSTHQQAIDALIAAPEWNDTLAVSIFRAAAWPYREYVDILRAAWRSKAIVIALGPPADWREKGIDYDRFMAERVIEVVRAKKRVVVFCGLHHAFTHYYQPELDLKQRPMSYMDRMGNILWRKYARAVFMIALHRPMWCGDTEPLSYCLPLDGEIDCAGVKLNRGVGFDLAGSPIGSRELEAHIYYSRATPRPRLVDFADGYIWFQPIERYRAAMLIPLAEFAPDDASLAEVVANNPFSDKQGLTRAEIEALWAARTAKSGDVMALRGWSHLAQWRDRCRAD